MQIKKIPETSRRVKKTDYNAKITKIESKISSISDLDTTSVLTTVENKKPDVIQKTDYHAEIWEIEAKYITTADWNKFAKNIVDNSIKSKNLVDKSAISGFTKNADLDKKK